MNVNRRVSTTHNNTYWSHTCFLSRLTKRMTASIPIAPLRDPIFLLIRPILFSSHLACLQFPLLHIRGVLRYFETQPPHVCSSSDCFFQVPLRFLLARLIFRCGWFLSLAGREPRSRMQLQSLSRRLALELLRQRHLSGWAAFSSLSALFIYTVYLSGVGYVSFSRLLVV